MRAVRGRARMTEVLVAIVEVPDSVLPSPPHGPMPAPIPLRRMLGPGVILAGLSIGSGELILWPRLVLDHGFDIFWAACCGVTLQFFLNLEIERWTMLTGESAVVGFLRLSRVFGPVFFLCGTLPWIWPGWATGAAQLATKELGGDTTWVAIGGLVACAIVLTTSPVIYRTLETVQLVLVATIFVLLGALALAIVRAEDVVALVAGAVRIGYVPASIDLPLFLGALAFAGAGGSVNLAQSNYVKDKGYGMGKLGGRLTSPFTGRDEAESQVGTAMDDAPQSLARFRVWWRRANVEHFFTFFLLCIGSLALLCLIARALVPVGVTPGEDLAFLSLQADVLAARIGPIARGAFVVAAIAVLLSTELALLDAVARVAADVLRGWRYESHPRWTLSRLYVVLVWGFVAVGALVLVSGFTQPLRMLRLSAALNAGVMFLYAGLLLVLSLRSLRPPVRPSLFRIGMLVACVAFYGGFGALTLAGLAGLR